MSEFIEQSLRDLVDPSGQLPVIKTLALQKYGSGQQDFRFQSEGDVIGSAQVRRAWPLIGRKAIQLDRLEVKKRADRESYRYAAILSLLAVSADERRLLVTGPGLKTHEEVLMWYRLVGSGLATLDGLFQRVPSLTEGAPLFEGRAFAVPVTELHR